MASGPLSELLAQMVVGELKREGGKKGFAPSIAAVSPPSSLTSCLAAASLGEMHSRIQILAALLARLETTKDSSLGCHSACLSCSHRRRRRRRRRCARPPGGPAYWVCSLVRKTNHTSSQIVSSACLHKSFLWLICLFVSLLPLPCFPIREDLLSSNIFSLVIVVLFHQIFTPFLCQENLGALHPLMGVDV
ncbi:hypothetical protein BX600DRAFT_170003 [Xylariales sp. PMI_506]|nr:hypothetical protein BX600DRAFT_170003 [Xylariales sp. PMI_506]